MYDFPSNIAEGAAGHEQVLQRKLTEPEEIERRARSLQARLQLNPRPDFSVIIIRWTADIQDWTQILNAVAPYRNYVDRVPRVAEPFRAAIRTLIFDLQKFLQHSNNSGCDKLAAGRKSAANGFYSRSGS